MGEMNRRKTGSRYEQKAVDYLERRGITILERNYRCRSGEIDVIAEDERYLVFVEVKYRRDTKKGDPAEAVGFYKQRRIRNAAEYYLYCHQNRTYVPCRFDVVSILGEEIRWIKNAF